MNELYNLPIKFNDEERENYKVYGLKEAKFLKFSSLIISLIFILAIIYKYGILFGLFHSDYWQYRLEIWGLTGQNSSFLQLFTYTFWIDLVLIIACVLIAKMIDLIFKLICKPIIQKHVQIILDSKSGKANLKVCRNDEVIDEETIELKLLNNKLNLKTNEIKINNNSYLIGVNNRKNIYLNMDPAPYLSQPKEYKNMTTDLTHFNNVINGLEASLEEQNKEQEWLKNNS